jgi:tetraacyldisaccharide 4'-kinase
MINFFEKLYYNPKWYYYIVSILLLPFSIIYGVVGLVKYLFIKPKDYGIKIISIGNLVVGGSGKTPVAISLIEYLQNRYNIKITYISRGYGRDSKGLVVVKKDSKILCNVKSSGDEAMLVANSCKCDVIVSENREKAIELAKKNGTNLIILDDAFSKVGIKKFDILLEPKEVPNRFVIPSGPLREFDFAKNRANLLLKEDIDFKREVTFDNLSSKMLLVTAIANPARLEPFLPKDIVGEYILKDHSYFNKEKIIQKMQEFNAKTILVTQKDMVKLQDFNLPISLMKLNIVLSKNAIKIIEEYYEKED